MSPLFPELLRAVISTTANVLLMGTLLQPKYSKKITVLTLLGILAADLGTAIYCYLSGNLTLLSKLDIVLFAVLCFAVRPLFKDTFMEETPGVQTPDGKDGSRNRWRPHRPDRSLLSGQAGPPGYRI